MREEQQELPDLLLTLCEKWWFFILENGAFKKLSPSTISQTQSLSSHHNPAACPTPARRRHRTTFTQEQLQVWGLHILTTYFSHYKRNSACFTTHNIGSWVPVKSPVAFGSSYSAVKIQDWSFTVEVQMFSCGLSVKSCRAELKYGKTLAVGVRGTELWLL